MIFKRGWWLIRYQERKVWLTFSSCTCGTWPTPGGLPPSSWGSSGWEGRTIVRKNNLYSFLARLPLHIFWRKMMMPGINWDRAFSSSKRVDGDLSRNHSHLHISSSSSDDYLTKTFVLPKVTSLRNCRSSSSTLLTIVTYLMVRIVMMMMMMSMMTMTWFPPLHHPHGSLAKWTGRSSCTWDVATMATILAVMAMMWLLRQHFGPSVTIVAIFSITTAMIDNQLWF